MCVPVTYNVYTAHADCENKEEAPMSGETASRSSSFAGVGMVPLGAGAGGEFIL